jgi:3-oxoacyl-[acyl-carrier protein] reductase
MPIRGKTVLVTGSSRGLGAEIAVSFALAGANVVVNYSRDCEGAERTAAACRAEGGGDAIAIRADVRDSEAVDAMFEQARAHFGRVDVLVNNAGALTMPDGKSLRGPLGGTCDEAIRLLIDSHLIGTITCSRAALQEMEPRGEGAIISISSTATTRALPGHAVYAAAKAGVEGFTRALAYEAAKKGVRVNAVRAGWLDSPSNAPLTSDAAATNAFTKRFIPANRLGAMGEVAASCLFLASEAAAYMAGEVLTIDGGMGL